MTRTTARRRADPHPVPPPSDTAPIEALGPVDRAWLEMDDPRNPMVVSAILELKGPVRAAALRKALAGRLLRYHRFRQRVDLRHGAPRWVHEPGLNLEYHVRTSELPRQAPEAELRAAIARELGAGLDRALPLWRITLYPRPRGAMTVLFRGHHAMGDGMAFLHVLMTCADGADGPGAEEAPTAVPRHGPLGGVIGRLENVNTMLENLLELAADDLRHPSHVLEQVREGRHAIAAVGRVLALPDDNPGALRHELSGRRAVGWTAGIPFAPVRRLAHAAHVKVNDVFLSALAGAFGRYLRQAGVLVRAHQNLRVSIPVNLRSPDDQHLGNYFGLVLLDLPVGLSDPQERLATVAARMDELKHSPEARAVLLTLAAAGRLPVAVEKRLVNLVGGKAVAVVSNLPGPRKPLSFAGARLANMVFWPPQAGGIGIGVSMFSYAGQVTLGVSADAALIGDPQRVAELFRSELERMERLPRRARPRRRRRPT